MIKNLNQLYALLGVPEGASQEEIKLAYKKKALLYHPDRHSDKKSNHLEAEEKFKAITEAYEILLDPLQRKKIEPHPKNFERENASSSSTSPPKKDSKQANFKTSPTHSRRESSKPSHSSDLKYTCEVSFEEAASGTEKTISFSRQNERGRQESVQVSFHIPPGVRQDQQLRLSQQGDRDPQGQPPGDLYVLIHLRKHPLFRREEDDVLLTIPLSYPEALWGTTLEIPTLTNFVSLRVPEGTSSGQILRLKGLGFPVPSGHGARGDLLVQIMVSTHQPSQLSSKTRDLLRQWTEIMENLEEIDSPDVRLYKEKIEQLRKSRERSSERGKK